MRKYKFTFLGVLINSSAKRKKVSIKVEASNIKEALLKLYNTHEHITVLKVNGKAVDKDYSFKDFV